MRRLLTRVCTLSAVALLTLTLAPAASAQSGDEVRIVRDGFGVPHVYSDTLEGVSYGAGYAIAQDRLWQLEVLRALGKGEFQRVFGPIPGFDEMDRSARLLFYTDEERLAKFERLPAELRGMYLAFVDGINAWMDEARTDPTKLPLEFTEFGLGPPEPWDITDSIAIADTLVETFGAGGGSEVDQAELLAYLTDTFGEAEGEAAFDDVRWLNDPAAPVSIPRGYEWESQSSAARDLPAKDWRRDARLGLSDAERAPLGPAAAARPPAVGTRAQASLLPEDPSSESVAAYEAFQRGKEQLLTFLHFGSNAYIGGPQVTEAGGTLQLGGPQVGQFAPQIIAEFGLHSPENGLDMVGLTFAGAGPIVLIGRGPDFAFTTTTGNSDGADVYVEQLGDPADDGTPTYVFDGQLESMDCREETIPQKSGLPGETIEVCRTRHGPVISMDEDNGVAYSIRRSWFDMETGTFNGFTGYNFVDSIEDFATAANLLQSNHNMFYSDASGDYGYWHPGALPIRAPGTDVRLPQDGTTSDTEWVRLRTAEEVPHAVNFPRGWLTNWNNKPAVSWDNGDGANYGAVFRSQLWNDLSASDLEMTIPDLEGFNRINGTTELEFDFFRDHIVRAGRASDDEQVRAAAEILADWDTRREDTDGDGLVDSEPGYIIWDDWRSVARDLAFDDDLAEFSGRSSDSMLLHVIEGDDASLVKSRDWLNGEDVDTFLNRVMRANLDAIAADQETDDMSQWASAMPTQHYTRLNAAFYTCEVARAAASDAACDDSLPGNVRTLDYMNRGTYNHIVEFRSDAPAVHDDPPPPSAAPIPAPLPTTGGGAIALGAILLGVALAIAGRRGRRTVTLIGTTVALGALVTSIGVGAETFVEDRDGYTVEAESIISPGQSGFIDHAGQQSPHYEDQHDLYANWVYKPMPLREDDVTALGDGAVTTLTYTP